MVTEAESNSSKEQDAEPPSVYYKSARPAVARAFGDWRCRRKKLLGILAAPAIEQAEHGSRAINAWRSSSLVDM
jgi:hypothetical protein